MTIKELQEKRLTLANTIKELGGKKDAWTAEDEGQWETVNRAYDENKAELDKALAADEKASKIANRMEEIEREAKAFNIDPRIFKNNQHEAPTIGRDGSSATDHLPLAIQGWMRNSAAAGNRGQLTKEHQEAAKRTGINLASPELCIPLFNGMQYGSIRNAMSTQSGPDGGYTFGDTFVASLEQAMLAYGGMLQVADVMRTASGEPMRWPTVNDTTNTGRQIGESAAVGTATNPAFAQIVWYAYKFTSDEILVPFELLRDSAFNLAGILSGMLGERLGRIMNTKFTVGTGQSTPNGIVTASTAGVIAASTSAIAFDELIDLEHTIDPSRRKMPGVGYMFHDSILKALRKLKDGESRYLWQAGANSGAPDTLNTYRYTVNQDMASVMTSGAKTILFGQLSAYKIRQVGQLRLYRLVERYRENDQDAFLAFLEGDGNLMDAGDHPVKRLTH